MFISVNNLNLFIFFFFIFVLLVILVFFLLEISMILKILSRPSSSSESPTKMKLPLFSQTFSFHQLTFFFGVNQLTFFTEYNIFEQLICLWYLQEQSQKISSRAINFSHAFFFNVYRKKEIHVFNIKSHPLFGLEEKVDFEFVHLVIFSSNIIHHYKTYMYDIYTNIMYYIIGVRYSYIIVKD